MGKRKPVERARARTHAHLVRDLERLARVAPGGSPERPVDVEAPTLVEPIARARPCPLCDGGMHVEDHAAEVHAGVRLRVARVRCVRCGVPRAVYFRLAGTLPH
jgi:hypothetical protein